MELRPTHLILNRLGGIFVVLFLFSITFTAGNVLAQDGVQTGGDTATHEVDPQPYESYYPPPPHDSSPEERCRDDKCVPRDSNSWDDKPFPPYDGGGGGGMDECDKIWDFCKNQHPDNQDFGEHDPVRACVIREQIGKNMHCVGEDDLEDDGSWEKQPPLPYWEGEDREWEEDERRWEEEDHREWEEDRPWGEDRPPMPPMPPMPPIDHERIGNLINECEPHTAEKIERECKERCSYSPINGCVESCVKRGVGEHCRGRGREEDRREDRGPGDGGGCRPFEYNMFGGPGVSPQEQSKMYKEKTIHWIEDVAREHGEDLTVEEAEKFPLCPGAWGGGQGGSGGMKDPEFHRFEDQGPSVVGQGSITETRGKMMPPGKGPEGMGPPGQGGVGGVIGMMIGKLVTLSQDPNVPEDAKQKVREAISWFSEMLNRIAAGENVGDLIQEAKGRIEEIMNVLGPMGGPPGQGGGYGPPPVEHIRGAIEHMIKIADKLIHKIIPRAFLIAEEMGEDVSSLRSSLAGIENKFGEIKEECTNAIGSDSHEDLKRCIDDLKYLLDKKLEAMGEEAEDILSEEAIDRIDREVFDEFEDEMGPPPDVMGSTDMGPPPWEEDR